MSHSQTAGLPLIDCSLCFDSLSKNSRPAARSMDSGGARNDSRGVRSSMGSLGMTYASRESCWSYDSATMTLKKWVGTETWFLPITRYLT